MSAANNTPATTAGERETVDPETEINRAVLARFQKAWGDRDIEALMALVTDDVVYSGSIGPEPGETWRGREAVRKGFAQFLAFDTGKATAEPGVFFGDTAYAGWSWTTDGADGPEMTARGYDVFTFRDGKIASKDGFRKTYPASGKPLASPPGAIDGSTTPYRHRAFRHLGLHETQGIAVKMYWINAGHDEAVAPDALVKALRREIDRQVPEIHDLGGHHGLGYAIVHSGADGTWLLLHWWAFGEINCHILMLAPAGSHDFTRLTDTRINACVWESVVIEHERQAFIRTMLTTAPDPAAWHADTLPDGDY